MLNIDVKVIDEDGVEQKLETLTQDIGDAVDKHIHGVAINTASDAADNVYKGASTRTFHKRTGALQRSIKVGKKYLSYRVYSNLLYAPYVEYGSKHGPKLPTKKRIMTNYNTIRKSDRTAGAGIFARRGGKPTRPFKIKGRFFLKNAVEENTKGLVNDVKEIINKVYDS